MDKKDSLAYSREDREEPVKGFEDRLNSVAVSNRK